MKLTIQIREWNEDEVDFLDALVQTCGENFASGEKADELDRIRDTLIENNRLLDRLIVANPRCADSYRRQHQKAEDDIRERISGMNIFGVKLEKPVDGGARI